MNTKANNIEMLNATKTGPARRDARRAVDHGWNIESLTKYSLHITHPAGYSAEAEYSRASNGVLRGFMQADHAPAAGICLTGTPGRDRTQLLQFINDAADDLVAH